MNRLGRAVAGFASTVAIALVAASGAAAATTVIKVTYKQDEANDNSHGCSLREAVRSANENMSYGGCTQGANEGEQIQLPAGTYNVTLPAGDDTAATGDLDVLGDLDIVGLGKGATIDAGGSGGMNDRVFELRNGDVTFRNVTITGGRTTGGAGGGGIRILAGRNAILRNSKMIANTANGPGAFGGAIYNDGGRVKVFDSLIAANSAPFVGGIDSAGSAERTTIRRSTIRNNDGAFASGGLFLAGEGSVISDSLIQGNKLDSETGNQNGAGAAFSQGATLVNVTVAGNKAMQGGGGLAAYNNATVDLVNVTVANNEADSALPGNSDGTGDGGGLFSEGGGAFRLRSTVVANNSDATTVGNVEPDCSAQVFLAGNNLIRNHDGCSLAFQIGSPANLAEGTNPKLLPLADFGGPTKTMAIRSSSPLRNRIKKNDCNSAEGGGAFRVGHDQRGVPRPQSSKCDVGAYEYAACAKHLVNKVGTTASETLNGSSKADGILGRGGNDKLFGKGGNDGLCGGGGRDKLVGGRANDRLIGGPKNDRLVGGPGRDKLVGGPGGDDVCIGGPGKDRAVGCEVERSI